MVINKILQCKLTMYKMLISDTLYKIIHVHVYVCECLKLSIIMLVFYRLIPGFGIVQ